MNTLTRWEPFKRARQTADPSPALQLLPDLRAATSSLAQMDKAYGAPGGAGRGQSDAIGFRLPHKEADKERDPASQVSPSPQEAAQGETVGRRSQHAEDFRLVSETRFYPGVVEIFR